MECKHDQAGDTRQQGMQLRHRCDHSFNVLGRITRRPLSVNVVAGPEVVPEFVRERLCRELPHVPIRVLYHTRRPLEGRG